MVLAGADEIARIKLTILLAGWVVVLVGWVVVGWKVGARIGEGRGRRRAGACLGAILGPLGWLITAVLPRTIAAEAEHQLRIEAEVEHRRSKTQA